MEGNQGTKTAMLIAIGIIILITVLFIMKKNFNMVFGG